MGNSLLFSSKLLRSHCADADIRETLRVTCFVTARITATGPDRRGAAVGVAEAQVVEINLEGAGLAAFENEAVVRKNARCAAAQADDPMFPHSRTAAGFGTGGLFATKLIKTFATLEIE